MKNQKLLILLGVFGVLLIYVLLTQTGEKGFNTIKLPKLKTVTVEEISKIELKKGPTTLLFEKKEDKWFILKPIEFAADINKINALTRTLSEMRLTDKISDQTDVDADFGLNSLIANYLAVTDQDGRITEVFLGKSNSSRTHTFAKLKDDPAVYQVIGNFENHYNYQPEDWRSLKIFDFSRDSVQAFTIKQKGKKELTVAKKEEVEENIVNDTPQGATPTALPSKMVWKAEGRKKPLNDPKVNQFLNAFTRLTATTIVESTSIKAKPLSVITVRTIDKTYYLTILKFDKTNKRYLIKGLLEEVFYEIPEYQGQNFLKELKDFNL